MSECPKSSQNTYGILDPRIPAFRNCSYTRHKNWKFVDNPIMICPPTSRYFSQNYVLNFIFPLKLESACHSCRHCTNADTRFITAGITCTTLQIAITAQQIRYTDDNNNAEDKNKDTNNSQQTRYTDTNNRTADKMHRYQ